MSRPNHVRTAVADLVNGSSSHAWTLRDVHAALTSRGVLANESTVFRALVGLCESGDLERFDPGDGRARFERRDHHHEHVVCVVCGAVAAVPGCLLDGAAGDVERLTGFSVTGHRLTFDGRCRPCAEAA